MAGMKVAFQFVADAVGLIGGVRVAREELNKLGATAAATGANLRQTSNKDGVAGLDAQRQAATGAAQALNRLGAAANDSGAALRKVATGDEAAGLTAQGKAANGLANDLGLVSARSAALTAAHGAGAAAARAQSDALQSYGRQASTANDNTLTLSSAIGGLKSGFSLLGGLLGVEALRQFAGEALETRKGLELLDVRLKSLIGTSGDYAETQNFLATSANRLSVDQKTLTNTYAQLLDLKKADLVTTGQARTLLEGFVNIQKATGASTDELKLSMVGMAQGFSAGVLHAEELAQVTEPLPGLMQALDRAAGTTSGGFRRMVNDGKVTSSMFRDVLIKAMQDYAGAAEKAANTIDAAETRRRNAQERLKNEAGRQIAPHYIAANDKATSVLDWGTSFLQDNSRQNDFNKLVRLYKDRRAANYQLENASGAAETARWTEKLERLNALILETERSLTQLGGATEDTRRGMAELWKETDSGVKITGDQIAAFTEAAKAAGYSYEKGKLLTSSQSELGQAVSAVNALLGKSPDALKAMGLDATSLTQVLDHLREKLDPVTAAIVQLKREAETLSVGPKYRDLYQTLDKAEQDKGKPLTADESADLTAGWRRKKTAEANDQIQALGEQLKAERDYQKAVASGNVVQIARAEAKKKVADAVANGFPAAQKDKLLEQETALALERVSGAAGAAATDLGAATTATMRLAQAAGAGEAAQRAATYANKEAEATLKGNIALSAVRAANAQDEAAAILTIRNETVRGLALETANTNALTTAMAAGGEAVRVAQENEYKLGLIRKLGTDATVAGTAAQRALNDAMDAYRANRAANDNNKLEQERRAANDNLALAQREIDLMGEAEPLRSRALTSLQNQQEAARKVAELGEEGARQWLAWQEQIADKRAYVDFLKSVQATAREISKDVSEALYDRLMDPSKATSVVDVFKAIFKRIAVAALETQIVLPIVTQVVGSMPGLFGIQAPASGGQAATGGGLTNTLSNTALSKAGGWAMDKLGLSGGWDGLMNTPLWGSAVSMSSTGAAAYTGTLVANPALYGPGLVQAGSLNAANGVVNAGNLGALNASYSGTTTGAAGTAGGTLGGVVGAAGAGAFGGVLGGYLGTAANSKAVGGLSGAALGAGSAALASYMGLGALGGPVGLAIGAVVGGIMGLIGTTKKSVGPTGQATVFGDVGGTARFVGSAADNGGDAGPASQAAQAAVAAINAVYANYGGKLGYGYGNNPGIVQQGGKFTATLGDGLDVGKYDSADEAAAAFVKATLTKASTDISADVQTALANSASKTLDDLAKDLDLAGRIGVTDTALKSLDTSLGGIAARAKETAAETYKTALEEKKRADGLGLGARYAEVATAQIRSGWANAAAAWTPLETALAEADGRAEALKDAIKAMGLAISAAEVDAAHADEVARLRRQALAGWTRDNRDARGVGALSGLEDLVAAMNAQLRDAAALGEGDALIRDTFGRRVNALFAGLAPDQLDAVTRELSGAGVTLTGASADMTAAILNVARGLSTATAAAQAQAAQQALVERNRSLRGVGAVNDVEAAVTQYRSDQTTDPRLAADTFDRVLRDIFGKLDTGALQAVITELSGAGVTLAGAGADMTSAILGVARSVQTGAQAAAAAAASEQLLGQRRQLEATIAELSGDAAGALAIRRKGELAAMDESLRPLQSRIYGLQDEAAAAQKAAEAATAAKQLASSRLALEAQLLEAMGDATGALSLRRQAELDTTDASLRGLQQQVWAAQDRQSVVTSARNDYVSALQREASTLTSLRDRWTSLASAMRGAITDLRLGGLSPLAPAAGLEAARQQVKDLYAQSQGSGVEAQDAMASLPEAVKTFLAASRAYNYDQTQYLADFDWSVKLLESSESVAKRQLSVAEQTLRANERQLTALGQVTDAVLSLADAQARYEAALAGGLQTQTAAIVGAIGASASAQAAQQAAQAAASGVPTGSSGGVNQTTSNYNSLMSSLPSGLDGLRQLVISNAILQDNLATQARTGQDRYADITAGRQQVGALIGGLPDPATAQEEQRPWLRQLVIALAQSGFSGLPAYRMGGVVGGYQAGGLVGNGLYDVDSVRARYAGGGDILLAGGEHVTRAPSVNANTRPMLDYINVHAALPALPVAQGGVTLDVRPVTSSILALGGLIERAAAAQIAAIDRLTGEVVTLQRQVAGQQRLIEKLSMRRAA